MVACLITGKITDVIERVKKSNVAGMLLTEAKYINLSLHYLEQVYLPGIADITHSR